MGINIFEIKAVLRSILVSSTVVINVSELNKDFKEQMGNGIPYKELGFNSLLGFLKSIPDVLLVKGDSSYSAVILVESEKSAHVSELVLKQKPSKKPGAFHSKNISRGARRHVAHPSILKKTFVNTPRPQHKGSHNENKSQPVVAKPNNGDVTQKACCDKNERESTRTNEQQNHRSEVTNNIPENNSSTIHLEKSDNSENRNSKILSNNEILENNSVNESTKLLRRINYKADSPNLDKSIQMNDSINEQDSSNLNVFLKASAIQKNKNNLKGGETGILRQTNNTYDHISEIATPKNFVKYYMEPNMASSNVTNIDNVLRHGCQIKNSNQKNRTEKWKSHNVSNGRIKNSRIANSFCNKQKKSPNSIPKIVKDDLQNLISGFPEGLWCAELPTAYKNLIGQDLDFEQFGYRCLSHLCLDLENIFHCIRESPCDFKLYDASKPKPEIKTNLDQSIQSSESSTPDGSSIESTQEIPEMTWDGFECFLPKDAVKLGYKMERLQVADIFEAGTSVNVVVAEIYDISKFWVYLDDSKLDTLMREMQVFYEINNKYVLPKSLLAEGLYCVVLYQSKFHRAVIVNVMIGEDYVKVYYIDFGTLGTASKRKVWFMVNKFSELPCQAIRARLADVYPPHEGVTWSPFANYDFSRFTCMKKLIADILRIDKHKNLIDIKLRNVNSSYISDILVEEKHALFINKTPKKHIEDSNCESKVKFIHLFPTFEEIENWVVPSMEEAADFLNTPVTADFLYSQYFSRKIDKDLINSVEEKMKIIATKKKALTRYIKPEELSSLQSMEEMNKIAYGKLYDPVTTETEDGIDLEQNGLEKVQEEVDSKNNSWVDIQDDETLARILRQSRMKKIPSFEGGKVQEDGSKGKSTIRERRSNSRRSSINKGDLSWQKFRDNARELSNLSELEKYLSDEDSLKDASKKSSPNLIDLDTGNLSSFNDSSTNLLLCSEFDQSLLDLARSRNTCQNCLLTEYTANDMDTCVLVNPLDLPIPSNINSYSVSSDLIQFNEDEASDSDPNEANYSIENNPIFKVGSEELSDADDEDSDSKQNYNKHLHDSCHSKAPRYKFLHESTETNTKSIEANNFSTKSSENSNMLNISESAGSNREADHNYVLSTTIDQDISESKICKSTVGSNPEECNMNLDSTNNDMKTDLSSFHTHQSISEKKHLSSGSNQASFSSNSIVTIDSVEFNNLEILEAQTMPSDKAAIDATVQNDCDVHKEHLFSKGVECSEVSASDVDNLIDLKDDGNIHESSSSTNLYYSCESKQSSIPDSSGEESFDLTILNTIDSSADSYTSLPDRNDSKSDGIFLEEFEMDNVSPTLSSNSDGKNELVASDFSILSGEWLGLELSTSKLETDKGNFQVSQSTMSETKQEGNHSDMDIEHTLNSSCEIIGEVPQTDSAKENQGQCLSDSLSNSYIADTVLEIPVPSNNANLPLPVLGDTQSLFPPNYVHNPRIIVRGPPPGFPAIPPGFPPGPPPGFSPIPPRGYSTALVPNSMQYPNGFVAPNIPMHCISVHQQDLLNEMAQYYRTPPIVIFNYNFLPPSSQNGNS